MLGKPKSELKPADVAYAIVQQKQRDEIKFKLAEQYRKEGKSEEAIKFYKEAARGGHTQAQYELGLYFDEGIHVTQNLQEAVTWYRLAALAGYGPAQLSLGSCYEKGDGVRQDYKEALKFFQQAAKQGVADADDALGKCYEYGRGVTRNIEEAVKFYQRAADAGSNIGQNSLGGCYETGKGVKKSVPKAIKLYKLAATAGFAEAQYNLGWLCGKKGGAEEEATAWYERAAKQGHTGAQNSLGSRYQFGTGVEPDINKAITWYKRAADQGDAEAQNNLGKCHEKGWGVGQNREEAARLYKLSSSQGYELAHYNLGRYYEEVKQDIKEAVRLYRLAAKKTYPSAQNKLGECYKLGKGVKQDQAEAVRLFTLAANRGNKSAQNNLRLCAEEAAAAQASAEPEKKTENISKDLTSQTKLVLPLDPILYLPYKPDEEMIKAITRTSSLFIHSAMQMQRPAEEPLRLCYTEEEKKLDDQERPAFSPEEMGEQYFQLGANADENELYDDAIKYYEQASILGSANAQVRLGYSYEKGIHVEKNEEIAVRLYQSAAEKGHPFAQIQLGWHYERGVGVPQDSAQAFHYYQSAANQNNDAVALFMLYRCFSDGIGVAKNLEEAQRLYHSAFAWNSETIHEMERNAEDGDDCAQFTLKCFNAWKGDANAQFELAEYYMRCYQDGCNEEDSEMAVKWYKKAAQQNNSQALYRLGKCYESGVHGVERNLSVAVQLYQKAAEQGHPKALLRLTECREKGGADLERELEKTVHLHRELAEKERSAITHLDLAMHHLKCAAILGNAQAAQIIKSLSEEKNQEQVRAAHPNTLWKENERTRNEDMVRGRTAAYPSSAFAQSARFSHS